MKKGRTMHILNYTGAFQRSAFCNVCVPYVFWDVIFLVCVNLEEEEKKTVVKNRSFQNNGN